MGFCFGWEGMGIFALLLGVFCCFVRWVCSVQLCFFNLTLLPHKYFFQHSEIAPGDQAFLGMEILLSLLAEADLFVLQ